MIFPGEVTASPVDPQSRASSGGLSDVHHYTAFALLAVAVFTFVLGQCVSLFGLHLRAPLDGGLLPDAIYFVSRGLLILGIILLPMPSLTKVSRQRVMVDVLMAMVAVLSCSWYFVVGPELLRRHQQPITQTMSVSSSILDLVLVLGLVLLSTHLRDVFRRHIIALLVAALTLIVGADVAQAAQAVHSFTIPGNVIADGKFLGFLLVAVAIPLLRRPIARDADSALPIVGAVGVPTVWRYLLPYTLLPAVVAVMLYAAHTPHDQDLEFVLYLLGVAFIELVFVHQYLAYRELIAYANKSARLESLAAADPITGLPNHRTIVSSLDMEVDRCRRYGHPCSVLFLDLDHFKSLNDTFGHLAGDAALRELATLLKGTLRTVDVVGRWGGEEFVAVLPETDTEVALSIAERVRHAVATHSFKVVAGRHMTCSIGLATYPGHGRDRDALVKAADHAMYAAKQGGRDRVCLDVEPSETMLDANRAG